MTFFGRTLLVKSGNPYHDANGLFTSAGGVGAAAAKIKQNLHVASGGGNGAMVPVSHVQNGVKTKIGDVSKNAWGKWMGFHTNGKPTSPSYSKADAVDKLADLHAQHLADVAGSQVNVAQTTGTETKDLFANASADDVLHQKVLDVLGKAKGSAAGAYVDNKPAINADIMLAIKAGGTLNEKMSNVWSALKNSAMGDYMNDDPNASGLMNGLKAAVGYSGTVGPLASSAPVGVGDTDLSGYDRHDSYDAHISFGDRMNQRALTGPEQAALNSYKGSGYGEINASLRSGEVIQPLVFEKIANLDSATRSGTIPKGTVLFRGISGGLSKLNIDYPEQAAKQKKGIIDNGFVSTSTSRNFSKGWAGGGGVLFEMKVTKDMPGLHVGKVKGGDGEQEIVLPRGVAWRIIGYHKDEGSHVFTLESL